MRFCAHFAGRFAAVFALAAASQREHFAPTHPPPFRSILNVFINAVPAELLRPLLFNVISAVGRHAGGGGAETDAETEAEAEAVEAEAAPAKDVEMGAAQGLLLPAAVPLAAALPPAPPALATALGAPAPPPPAWEAMADPPRQPVKHTYGEAGSGKWAGSRVYS